MVTQENAVTRAKGLEAMDWVWSGAVAVIAALVFGILMADYAYPGESAGLMAAWQGLDPTVATHYPLTRFFARLFGGGNLVAPVCGAMTAALLYLLATFSVRRRILLDDYKPHAALAARLAGLVTAFVFVFSPAVLSASTHLEPRLFAAFWLVLSCAVFVGWIAAPRSLAIFAPCAFGVFWGLGLVDSALFLAVSPLALLLVFHEARARRRQEYFALAGYVLATGVTYFAVAALQDAGVSAALRNTAAGFRAYRALDGWMMVFVFTTLPFLISRFSAAKAFGEKSGFVPWVFHLAMTLFAIIAVATPLSTSAICAPYGITPVATCGFAAVTAGYLAAYWWLQLRTGRVIAYPAGGLLAVVLVMASFFGVYSFDSEDGAFADAAASQMLDDLGERTWFVTEGSFDNNLLLLAKKRGKELNLIALHRDLDRKYLDELAKTVRAKKLGGDRASELAVTLELGVLPFVQDWLAVDPQVANKVAILGAPDLWFSSEQPPVAESLFFGGDPKRTPSDAWARLKPLLLAEGEKPGKPWGSARLHLENNPMDLRRFSLRRHIGLVTTDRGVWLQDQKRNDEAFAAYDRVVREIDADNVSALLNLLSMADEGHPKAKANLKDYQERIQKIISETKERRHLWSLVNYYGYIRNPDAYIRIGLAWARSGRTGETLRQIRRAIDLVPNDKRSAFVQMLAALSAGSGDPVRMRRDLDELVAKDGTNRLALMNLMRLALEDGDLPGAISYLERAIAAAGDDPRIEADRAMLSLMKDDLAGAREHIARATEAKNDDPQSLSLLVAVILRQIDATSDEKVKKMLEHELNSKIIPKLDKMGEKASFYAHSAHGFALLNKKGDSREARDAFARAAGARPDIRQTQDLVLGLDISIGDAQDAEARAKEMLRRDRNSPLANYVIGSLAMQKGDLEMAATYLRRAADARRPVLLALNDYAELMRLKSDFTAAERYARSAISMQPTFYLAWDTLANVLMDAKGDLAEAQRCVEKALELSKAADGSEGDVRMLLSQARVLTMRGDKKLARVALRKLKADIDKLSLTERQLYEKLNAAAH